MIKANELRVGNWVKFEYDTFFYGRVTSISERGVEILDTHKHVAPNCIFPIPLTPEILQKAGFKRTPYGSFWNDKIGSLTPIKNGGYDLDDTESGSVNSVPILYLHQLQNLYFSLTGEELNIQL